MRFTPALKGGALRKIRGRRRRRSPGRACRRSHARLAVRPEAGHQGEHLGAALEPRLLAVRDLDGCDARRPPARVRGRRRCRLGAGRVEAVPGQLLAQDTHTGGQGRRCVDVDDVDRPAGRSPSRPGRSAARRAPPSRPASVPPGCRTGPPGPPGRPRLSRHPERYAAATAGPRSRATRRLGDLATCTDARVDRASTAPARALRSRRVAGICGPPATGRECAAAAPSPWPSE